MQSTLLTQYGLTNMIAGSDYNFRYQKAGKAVVDDVERAITVLGIQPKEIYTGQQVHGHNIAYADGKTGEDFIFGKTFADTDGLITDQPGVALLIKYADCSPIVLFDPVKRVHASVHSGWRGTVQHISVRAIEKMEKEFQCQRENIIAFIGPSIDQENYEVGPEVYDAFRDFPKRDDYFIPKGEKYLLSMLDANYSLLQDSGIKADHIQVDSTSTFTSPYLHSARAEGKDYQLNGLITMMNETGK